MIGVLLINLGTPSAPTESAVRDYLDEFLSDPYVITLPKILRDFLVQKIILKTRPKKSAHAYQKVWTEQGSPLLVNSLALQKALQEKCGDDYCVALGMRYGNPTIQSAFEFLDQKKCEKIIVLPLFPQFAEASTQSALSKVEEIVSFKKITTPLHIISDFYNQDFYIDSFASIISEHHNPSHFLLFSYHGLPRRANRSDEYRRQCLITSQLIARKLNIDESHCITSFQSRLGLARWISPYTIDMIKQLRKNGVENISVVCPSFVSDCLETLEEIRIQLCEEWMRLGGKSFQVIPCLNVDERWVSKLAGYLASAVTDHPMAST